MTARCLVKGCIWFVLSYHWISSRWQLDTLLHLSDGPDNTHTNLCRIIIQYWSKSITLFQTSPNSVLRKSFSIRSLLSNPLFLSFEVVERKSHYFCITQNNYQQVLSYKKLLMIAWNVQYCLSGYLEMQRFSQQIRKLWGNPQPGKHHLNTALIEWVQFQKCFV